MIYQPIDLMARETGLEPATSGVTGREKAMEKARTVKLWEPENGGTYQETLTPKASHEANHGRTP